MVEHIQTDSYLVSSWITYLTLTGPSEKLK